MPPSASATPPTQTTQRVPNSSSKPIFCSVDDWTGEGDESGTDVGCGLGGAGEGVGSIGAATIGAGAGAGSALAAVAAPATTRECSIAYTLASSCRNRLRSVMLLIRATMPMIGAASSSSTIKTNKPSIGAPARTSPLQV